MYKLIIKNDNFKAVLMDDNTKKVSINCSIDIFDIIDKDFNISLSGLCNLEKKDFNYIATYIYWFFGIPTHSIEYKESNVINSNKIKHINITDIEDDSTSEKTIRFLSCQNVLNQEVITTYLCRNRKEITVACLYHFFKYGHTLNKCQNCGKYFITSNKSNEKYCSRIYDNKSCKEIMKREKGKRLEQDKIFKLRKNAYNTLRNQETRARLKNDNKTINSVIKQQNELIEKYPIWKEKLNNNKVSLKDYENWIYSFYKNNGKHTKKN